MRVGEMFVGELSRFRGVGSVQQSTSVGEFDRKVYFTQQTIISLHVTYAHDLFGFSKLDLGQIRTVIYLFIMLF